MMMHFSSFSVLLITGYIARLKVVAFSYLGFNAKTLRNYLSSDKNCQVFINSLFHTVLLDRPESSFLSFLVSFIFFLL